MQEFANQLHSEAKMHKFNEVVRLIGDDFAVYTSEDYKNIERLIQYFNEHPQYGRYFYLSVKGINLLFSSP